MRNTIIAIYQYSASRCLDPSHVIYPIHPIHLFGHPDRRCACPQHPNHPNPVAVRPEFPMVIVDNDGVIWTCGGG